MALIKNMEEQELEKNSSHRPVECTYTIINDADGKQLQIDSYGSATRKIKGKKSQSMRFDSNAVKQLKNILKDF